MLLCKVVRTTYHGYDLYIPCFVFLPPSPPQVLLKVNVKLGGVCHKLTSRIDPAGSPDVRVPRNQFKGPTDALGGFFDRPVMVVGADVTHATPGKDLRLL